MLTNPEKARPGRHRSSVRRYRPAHQAPGSLLGVLIPSWAPRRRPDAPEPTNRTRPNAATPRQASITLDEPSSRLSDADVVELRFDITDPTLPPLPVDPTGPVLEHTEPPSTPDGPAMRLVKPNPAPTDVPLASLPDLDELFVPEPPLEHVTPADRAEADAKPPRPAPRVSFAELLGFGAGRDTTVEYITEEFDLPEWPANAATATATQTEVRAPEWSDLRLGDVATSPAADTGELVQRLWEATSEHQAVGDVGAPIDVPQMLRSQRTFRWTVVVAAFALLVLGISVLQALGRRPVELAAAQGEAMQTQAARLSASLVGFDATARVITDPASDTATLTALTVELSSLDSFARDLAATAGETLPTPSLFGQSAPIERLEPPRQLLQQASERALTLERRLSDAVSYRIVVEETFLAPDLPVTATEDALADLGAALGVMSAETEHLLSRLPDDPFFGSHRAAADETMAYLATWQVDYLSALRDGDAVQAGLLRREWHQTVTTFRTDIAAPLGALEAWSSSELSHLRDLLERAEERLPKAAGA